MKVYFDNNATTPLHPQVKEHLPEIFSIFANSHSVHYLGREAANLLDDCRESIAGQLNCAARQIVFNTGASEGIQKLFNSLLSNLSKKSRILVSTVEHSIVLKSAESLTPHGFEIERIPVNSSGEIDLGSYEKMLEEDVALVAVMHTQNEIGNIYPIKQMASLAHEYGALFFSDLVQSVGKKKVDLQDLEIDFAVASAHKFHALKGCGFLYVREPDQNKILTSEPGTINVPGIWAMQIALTELSSDHYAAYSSLEELRNYMMDSLKNIFSDLIFFGKNSSVSNTINFGIPGFEAESLMQNLDLNGIAVSTGAACESGSIDPSHVILAMGYSEEIAKTSLRISLNPWNTREEVDYFIKTLKQIIYMKHP